MDLLSCGHPSGGPRCGMCDRCWFTCCTCGFRETPPTEEGRANQEKIEAARADFAVAETARREATIAAARAEGKATITGSIREYGRCRHFVLCPCGHENTFYEWSWAGHGACRCKSCKASIDFRTLSVEPYAKKAKR